MATSEAPCCAACTRPAHARIHRPFFIAALIITLTAGAAWGGKLLREIARDESFSAAANEQVNAHGDAQIYGFVGLFIMGFAYQSLPRMSGRTRHARRIAIVVLVAMCASLLLRVLASTDGGPSYSNSACIIAAGVLGTGAVATFVLQILRSTRRPNLWSDPSRLLISSALIWFLLSMIVTAGNTWAIARHGLTEMNGQNSSAVQSALRAMQVHGVAVGMILGIGIRFLPGLFNLNPIGVRLGLFVTVSVNAAVCLEVLGIVAYARTPSPGWAVVQYLAWLLLVAGTMSCGVRWRLWKPLWRENRSAKCLQAAFAWFAISSVLLALSPVAARWGGGWMGHAYGGAIRHAVTVGFITMMIITVSTRVIPGIYRVPIASCGSLWAPFILVNLGCAIRVTSQVLTDIDHSAFQVIAWSALLEITGLLWWGSELLLIMLGRKQSGSGKANLESTVV